MGDDILKATISFLPKEMPELAKIFKRISGIATEHEYRRFQFDMHATHDHTYFGIEINYRKPDLDGDRDGFYECALMIFFERVAGILEPMFGPEGQQWDLSCGMRLP